MACSVQVGVAMMHDGNWVTDAVIGRCNECVIIIIISFFRVGCPLYRFCEVWHTRLWQVLVCVIAYNKIQHSTQCTECFDTVWRESKKWQNQKFEMKRVSELKWMHGYTVKLEPKHVHIEPCQKIDIDCVSCRNPENHSLGAGIGFIDGWYHMQTLITYFDWLHMCRRPVYEKR